MTNRNVDNKKTAIDYQKSVMTLINDRIQRFVGCKIDNKIFYEIYQEIFNTVSEVMQESNSGVSNEFVNFVSQHIYDSISFGGSEGLNPNIFSQRAKMENLSKGELLLALPLMLSDVSVKALIHEVKGRG